MDAQQIISTYEGISDVMGKMVVAARAAEWDSLVVLEASCTQLVQALKSADLNVDMSAPLRARKATLLRKLLADDAEIRSVTEPWLGQLTALFKSAKSECKLQHTYQP